MIPLFDINDIDNLDSSKLEIKCEFCGNIFISTKKQIKKVLSNKPYNLVLLKYCSIDCRNKSSNKSVIVKCKNCDIDFIKNKHRLCENNFCSQSCSASYHNKNKTTGIRRSKLEIYLENNLKQIYTNLEIIFNNKKVIGSELDIYIPTLKIAFELNGIHHYK